jgi:hypothetical protein
MSSATVYVLERFIDRTDMAGTKGLMLSFDQVFGSKSIITILRQILITYNFMTSEKSYLNCLIQNHFYLLMKYKNY